MSDTVSTKRTCLDPCRDGKTTFIIRIDVGVISAKGSFRKRRGVFPQLGQSKKKTKTRTPPVPIFIISGCRGKRIIREGGRKPIALDAAASSDLSAVMTSTAPPLPPPHVDFCKKTRTFSSISRKALYRLAFRFGNLAGIESAQKVELDIAEVFFSPLSSSQEAIRDVHVKGIMYRAVEADIGNGPFFFLRVKVSANVVKRIPNISIRRAALLQANTFATASRATPC